MKSFTTVAQQLNQSLSRFIGIVAAHGLYIMRGCLFWSFFEASGTSRNSGAKKDNTKPVFANKKQQTDFVLLPFYVEFSYAVQVSDTRDDAICSIPGS